MNLLKPGHHTVLLGQELAQAAVGADYCLFYDHGNRLDRHVAAVKGFWGEKVQNVNRLADVDLIIGKLAADDSPHGTAELLIEIEERPCSPKKVLGDVLAILLCNHFAVWSGRKRRIFDPTANTRLIVAGVVPLGHSRTGKRLTKINDTIAPRLRTLHGVEGGILPCNVDLFFAESLDEAIHHVRRAANTIFNRIIADPNAAA